MLVALSSNFTQGEIKKLAWSADVGIAFDPNAACLPYQFTAGHGRIKFQMNRTPPIRSCNTSHA